MFQNQLHLIHEVKIFMSDAKGTMLKHPRQSLIKFLHKVDNIATYEVDTFFQQSRKKRICEMS